MDESKYITWEWKENLTCFRFSLHQYEHSRVIGYMATNLFGGYDYFDRGITIEFHSDTTTGILRQISKKYNCKVQPQ